MGKINEARPHFTSPKAEEAERGMANLLERAVVLGVEVKPLEHEANQIIEKLKGMDPDRYELVTRKLAEEGLYLSDLSKEALLDRMLGIDFLFEFQGRRYAVDVTSGKLTVVLNKQRKIAGMRGIYKQLGIDCAVVVRLREPVTDDLVLDLFSRLEEVNLSGEDSFCITVEYPARKES